MYKQIQLPTISNPQANEFKLDKIDGGLCLTDIEQNLKDNQSAKLLNMWWNGALSKRNGQVYLNNTAVEAHPILQTYDSFYNGLIIYHCNTSLYKCTTAGVSTSIYSGLSTNKGSFFLFNGLLYYIEGTKLIQWDGTIVSLVIPYIPTIIINCPLAGGGSISEGLNRIGAGFKVSFNGVTGTKIYQLPASLLPLDSTLLTAVVNGVSKVETTDFTVNRATGQVTWITEPITGQDNVIITAYKTNTTYVNSILNSKVSTVFGGTNSGTDGGTRAILANKSIIYYSGLNDASYWPDGNYNLIGTTDEDITTFCKAYNILVVFKAHSMYGINYDFDGTNIQFPVSTINDTIGCDMPYTVQLVNNNPVWCNTYLGYYILVSTSIIDERNVLPIGYNINGTSTRSGVSQESLSDLQNAVSVDSNGKYWTCIGTHVYLWDYGISPYMNSGDTLGNAKALSWYYFDNINANCFVINNQDLYYGDKTTGKIAKFITALNDFGSPINAVYRLPLRDMGAHEWLKSIRDLYINCRADTSTSMSMKYITEQDPAGRIDSQDILIGNFTFMFSLATFSLASSSYVKQFRRRPNCKKVDLFACEFTNDDIDRDMSILNIVYTYTLDKKKK